MCAAALREHEGRVRGRSQQREPLVALAHSTPDKELSVRSMRGLVGSKVGGSHDSGVRVSRQESVVVGVKAK
jgi:hypothetical protein